MPTDPKTDAEAALMALGEAKTWEEGIARFRRIAPDDDGPPIPWSWADWSRDFSTAVASAGWALLVAPEIHRIVQLHLAIRRIQERLADLILTADKLRQGIDHPRSMAIVEVKTGKAFVGPKDTAMLEIKVGPDILSVRATASAKVNAEIIKGEEALAKLGERLDRAIARYQATLIDWAALSVEQRRVKVLQAAARDGALPTALALIEVCKDPTDATTLLSTEARRARIAELTERSRC